MSFDWWSGSHLQRAGETNQPIKIRCSTKVSGSRAENKPARPHGTFARTSNLTKKAPQRHQGPQNTRLCCLEPVVLGNQPLLLRPPSQLPLLPPCALHLPPNKEYPWFHYGSTSELEKDRSSSSCVLTHWARERLYKACSSTKVGRQEQGTGLKHEGFEGSVAG